MALKKGKLDTALAKVNKAIRIEPKEASFYSLRGEIKVAKDKDKAALKDLDRAVALNPEYYRPLLVRGMARRQVGALKGASSDLQRSVSLLPTAEGYYGLGQVAQLNGRSDQAVKYFRTAATSKSQAGVLAGKQLARLDLPDNPSRYIEAALGLTEDGYLVVQLNNKSELAVKGVKVVVGVPVGGGIREKAAYRLDRQLAPGRRAKLRTDLGPMGVDRARRYAAVVTDARLAE